VVIYHVSNTLENIEKTLLIKSLKEFVIIAKINI